MFRTRFSIWCRCSWFLFISLSFLAVSLSPSRILLSCMIFDSFARNELAKISLLLGDFFLSAWRTSTSMSACCGSWWVADVDVWPTSMSRSVGWFLDPPRVWASLDPPLTRGFVAESPAIRLSPSSLACAVPELPASLRRSFDADDDAVVASRLPPCNVGLLLLSTAEVIVMKRLL